MSADLEFEPIPGLPAELPEGETIVWQGRPSWRALARRAFKIRWLAAYFAVLVALRAETAVAQSQGPSGARRVLVAFALAGACLGMVCLLAWLQARGTVYTLTTRRVVMRFGVVLPMAWNLPFKRIAAAEATYRKDGEGDIAFELVRPDKIAWLHLWPHVKPWTQRRPRPALRALPDAERVARLVATTVRDWGEREKTSVILGAVEEERSSGTRPVAAKAAVGPALAQEAGR